MCPATSPLMISHSIMAMHPCQVVFETESRLFNEATWVGSRLQLAHSSSEFIYHARKLLLLQDDST
jgi:hypothetical protein